MPGTYPPEFLDKDGMPPGMALSKGSGRAAVQAEQQPKTTKKAAAKKGK